MNLISTSLIKELREKTDAGMMNCKEALTKANGNFEVAINLLRQKGLASAAKIANKIASKGLTAIKVNKNIGAVIEINSETDFVARNAIFQSLVKEIANVSLDHSNVDSLKQAKLSNGRSVAEEIVENVAKIGENLSLRRMEIIKVNTGVIGCYVHNSVTDGVGQISVLVGLESAADTLKLQELGKQIAMHIAWAKPESMTIAEVSHELIERERNIFIEQSRNSGKPDNIIKKMIDGKINKFFEEIVLLEQISADNKTKISDLLIKAAKDLGKPVRITSFIRYEAGEGIIQEQKTNFADEVAAIIKQ